MLACGFSLSTFRFHTAEKELSEVDILMISAMLCNVDELVMNKVSAITGPPDAHRARLHPTRKAEDITDEDASGYRRSEGLF